jgi:hypothetical protein
MVKNSPSWMSWKVRPATVIFFMPLLLEYFKTERFERLNVSVTRRTTVRDSVNVVDDFYDIYG